MDFTYLKTRTTFSLRKSTIKPDDLVKAAKSEGASSLAITELGNVYTCVKIIKKCKEEKIKPILGCDFYIQGEVLSNFTVLCKNHQGWLDLLKAISISNTGVNYNDYHDVATISLDDLIKCNTGNWIVYVGCLYSHVVPQIVDNYKTFVKAIEYNEAKQLVKADWKNILRNYFDKLKDVFGKGNVYVESQKTEIHTTPAADIVVKIIEWAAKTYDIPCIATCRPHYLKPDDAEDQKILICVDQKSTLNNIVNQLHTLEPEFYTFFKGNNSYLLGQEEFKKLYSQEQLETNAALAAKIESFDILSSPKLPKFDCPDNITPEIFMEKLCREGLIKLNIDKPEYNQRLKYELDILMSIGLAPYFLIVWDIIKYCHGNNWLASSRGSVGGSLVAHSLGISEADPLKYNLIFERFYNYGRNSPGNISYPDIDADVQVKHRKDLLEYIKNKYSEECTGSIATFGGFQGAGALKEVLRVKNRCSTVEQNEITKLIIKQDKINDELEELRLAGEESSIIKWSLDNDKRLKPYAYYDNDGIIKGEYGIDFAQAIRLEGCKRTLGKHAAGIVISGIPLQEYCPMVHDRITGGLMCGLEKGCIESIGALKYDILGVAMLDDVAETIRLINEGDMYE